RRHTRCLSDWSSDVCSSDLPRQPWFSQFTTKTQRTQSKAETFDRLASSLCSLCLCGESLLSLLVLRRLGFADRGQQLLNDVLAEIGRASCREGGQIAERGGA